MGNVLTIAIMKLIPLVFLIFSKCLSIISRPAILKISPISNIFIFLYHFLTCYFLHSCLSYHCYFYCTWIIHRCFNFIFMSLASLYASASVISSGLTIIRTSRPACKAYVLSTPLNSLLNSSNCCNRLI